MAKLPFLEYRPDVSDLNAEYTRILKNVIPRADGYGPMKGIETFSDALAATCRGYFVARKTDGTVVIFAGTVDRLYQMSNTTLAWTDVSKGGSAYSSLDGDANWTFAQFGNFVIACQRNTVPQSFDVTSSSAFADLGGSPPQAGWVATVGSFLVLADLLSNPLRVQWSGLNAITTWTAGTNLSDFQDFADGGRLRAVVEISGQVGLTLQQASVKRMTFAAGSAEVFQFDTLQDVPGILAPYSATVATGGAYYLSPKGFVQVSGDGTYAPIGEERVNRSILGQHDTSVPDDVQALAYDDAEPQLVIGAADPQRNVVLWVYKSINGAADLFDKGMVYHTTLQRFSPIEVSGEYIAPVSRPGLTLEALDAIAPGAQTVTGAANNGSGLIRLTVGSTSGWTTGDSKTVSGVLGTTEANGTWTITVISGTTIDLQGSAFVNPYTSGGTVGGSLDALTISLDDISTATLPAISAMSTAHALGFFSGAALEATLETAEQSLDRRRMNINGFWPVTDADSVYGSIVYRDNLNESATEGTESAMDSDGFVPLLNEARYARGRVRIPAATTWTFATGIEPEVMKAGER